MGAPHVHVHGCVEWPGGGGICDVGRYRRLRVAGAHWVQQGSESGQGWTSSRDSAVGRYASSSMHGSGFMDVSKRHGV